MRDFDPYQREAIALSQGRHLVLAPPGCGKTDILTERIVEAHARGVDYADMLCLTFTNRAAKGMAGRIADRTGNPVPDDLFVGNIHRFCSQMLFNEGVVGTNSAIIDEGDVDNIIQEELCKRLHIEARSTETMRLQHAMRQLQMGMPHELILHGELLQAPGFGRLCDVLRRRNTLEELASIYADIEPLSARYATLAELPSANALRLAHAYEDYKAANDLLDYDDLLLLAYEHSKATGRRRYSWVEVDEVQDLNPLQLALIDLFATDTATIVYLGDEQQAIFSFIGAKLETLEGLKHQCAGHIHYLHHNYRSPSYLLDLQNDYAQRVLGIRPELLPTTANTSARADADLCLLNVADAQLEAYYTARFARRYGDLDPEGQIAILVSTNREADDISAVMTQMGTGHFKISGTDLFSTATVRTLLAHTMVLADELVFIAWARLMWGLGATTTYTRARNLMRDMRRVGLLPTDILLHRGSSYLAEMARAYDEEELIIFDTETTGLDVEHDDIIQIAAIRVRQGEQVGQAFNIILETDRELPATVGGHTNPMIEVYRTARRHPRAEGLRLFMDFCRGSVLVGHNVDYDYQILRHNLRRTCPDLVLEELCPRRFDTLKQARLVRPRLRNYKLGHLLQVLHLEGQNSHQADDDIQATRSLLNFCHRAALTMLHDQAMFVSDHAAELDKFATRYGPVYRHALARMDGSSLVDELDHAYRTLTAEGWLDPVDKWDHLLHYIGTDLVRTDLYPTLRHQIGRYTMDLCTCKEADLCGGNLAERYIISTVHKAKGLEFDTVIVYRGIDGNYPSARSWTDLQIQEDARKLFVALSRSRRRLCVTCDDYQGRSPHQLSPFLDKVAHHFTRYRRGPDGKIRPENV